jgi:hypothetical protein
MEVQIIQIIVGKGGTELESVAEQREIGGGRRETIKVAQKNSRTYYAKAITTLTVR